MTKTIAFKKPEKKTPDNWVAEGAKAEGKEPGVVPQQVEQPRRMVRFTLDVDADLHSRIKVACAKRGEKMSDVLRAVFEKEFPEA